MVRCSAAGPRVVRYRTGNPFAPIPLVVPKNTRRILACLMGRCFFRGVTGDCKKVRRRWGATWTTSEAKQLGRFPDSVLARRTGRTIRHWGRAYKLKIKNKPVRSLKKPGGPGTILETLDEGCVKAGWRVHAYCLMSNHFHLILETPQVNLVAGMR